MYFGIGILCGNTCCLQREQFLRETKPIISYRSVPLTVRLGLMNWFLFHLATRVLSETRDTVSFSHRNTDILMDFAKIT